MTDAQKQAALDDLNQAYAYYDPRDHAHADQRSEYLELPEAA